MLAKVVMFFCCIAAAAAYALPAPFSKQAHTTPHHPAQYEYQYSVKDEHNGDIKEQKEHRNGDAVHGFYSLVQPDGIRRIVEYTVDKEHGFRANVRYEGHANTPVNTAYTPKVTQTHPAPPPKVTYTPHVPKVSYSSPVSKISFTIHGHNPAYAASDANAAYSPAPEDYSASDDYADGSEDYDAGPVAYAAAPVANIVYADAPAENFGFTGPANVAPPANFAYASPASVQYDPAALALLNMAAQAGHVVYTSPAFSYQH